MKKIFIAGLFCAIVLAFTGCDKQKGLTLQDAIKVYGNNYQVVTLDNSNFLIKWDNTSLIFNNNQCVGVVNVK